MSHKLYSIEVMPYPSGSEAIHHFGLDVQEYNGDRQVKGKRLVVENLHDHRKHDNTKFRVQVGPVYMWLVFFPYGGLTGRYNNTAVSETSPASSWVATTLGW
ncbi:hypothetical protein BDN67DRAFT_974975 [Paxillus ammoniavirescens]|nr:hypothetical protein BDN67DRAFT_974975 [Paxillus ammoniavirescens]